MAYFHSVKFDSARCEGRLACLRVCPTEAVRVRGGKAAMLEDRCIDCGECLTVCPESAIVPLTDSFTDFSHFSYTLAIPSPALFAQFDRSVMPWDILSAIKAIGFDEACDVTRACEAANISIRMFLAEGKGPRPQISNSCPAVVRLLQVRYPELVHNIVPIEAPRETVAREAKNRISREQGIPVEEIGAIYITPCPAKMIAIREPAEEARSYLDGAIAISDVYGSLLSALSKPHETLKDEGEKFSGIGVGWARVGGFCNAFESESCLSTAGISNVLEVLDDIEQEKLRDVDFVELFTCRGGCIGGSLTVENVYLSRSKVINLSKKFGEPTCDPDDIAAQYREGTQFLRGPVLPRPIKPLDKDVGKAIEKMKMKEEAYEKLPKIDCGACGSPNCMAFAEDLVQGTVTETDCVFRMYGKLREISEDLSQFVDKLAPTSGK